MRHIAVMSYVRDLIHCTANAMQENQLWTHTDSGHFLSDFSWWCAVAGGGRGLNGENEVEATTEADASAPRL